jgi:hypothetical protein
MIRGFRQGLVVEDKDKRVANYVRAIVKDVETIAHSVGVSEPRKLTRRHVRIVQDDGRSIPMDRLNPTPTAGPDGLPEVVTRTRGITVA